MTPNQLVLCEVHPPQDEAVETWSPFCLKVHRALRAKGLKYERRFSAMPSDFKEFNPTGQVPVLLADGRAIYDSTQILSEIRQWKLPEAAPTAEALLYEELADTALNGFQVAARWADDENWQRLRAVFFGGAPEAAVAPVRAGIIESLMARDVWRAGPDRCWSRFSALLSALNERAPSSGYWVGPELSCADFGLFGQLQSFRTSLTPAQANMVQAQPRLVAWLDRVNAATH